MDQTSTIGLHAINDNFLLRGADGIGGLPVSALTGLPLGGNLVNLPINSLPNASKTGSRRPEASPSASSGRGSTSTSPCRRSPPRARPRTLARPEIVTVENNKATMSLGEELPYATVSSAGTQIQFKEALLKLEVTPTVIRDASGKDTIKMLVIVENNSRGKEVNLGSSGNSSGNQQAQGGDPGSGARRRAPGHRRGDHQRAGRRRTPGAGVRRLPVLGRLFESGGRRNASTELVVFVTPSSCAPNDRVRAAVGATPTPERWGVGLVPAGPGPRSG